MDLAAQFRQAAAEIEPARDRRGRRYSDTARRLAVDYCREQREVGRSFAEIAAALGISVATLGRWIETDTEVAECEVATFHPVQVATPVAPDASLSMTLPSGLRIDGLQLQQVVELARALS